MHQVDSFFKSPWGAWGKIAGAGRNLSILYAKQHRRPLPFLLYISFFYGFDYMNRNPIAETAPSGHISITLYHFHCYPQIEIITGLHTQPIQQKHLLSLLARVEKKLFSQQIWLTFSFAKKLKYRHNFVKIKINFREKTKICLNCIS